MSELQKFENSESWRAKLRNFLLKETEPQEKRNENFTETNRYSLDISEGLKKLIEEKKKKKMDERKGNVQDYENKENASCNYAQATIKQEELCLMADDTFLPMKSIEISDDSFEAMEMMCNKTASDPNSTLFQYLNSDQEVKNVIKQEQKEFVAEFKQKKSTSDYEPSQSASVEQDPEFAVVDRLLNNLLMEGQKDIADESPLKGVEMTQIEDIEAPSRFWMNDTILQTSPVKMVGLLRPSTILECAEMSNASSSQISFKSAATRHPLAEVSSSCYETASDTMSFNEQRVKIAAVEPDLIASVDFIDFEKTKQVTKINESTESIHSNGPSIKVEKLIDLTIDTDVKYDSDELEESVIEVPSDDEDEHSEEQPSIALIKFEDVALNFAKDQTIEQNALSTSTTSKEQSLHFNDTLEEVEYMMQKGLEYMAGAGITPKQSPFKPQTLPSPQLLTQKQNTFTVSPAKAEHKLPEKQDLIPAFTSNSTQKSPLKCDSRFLVNIKPIPKLELFKKPISATKPASRAKDKFAHVVSPIGTYIKKTPEPCFMSGVKTGSDDKNSSVFRELDFETRAYKPNFGDRKAELPKSPRTLPKKAYISSEYRQVVDDRSAVTIPGGKKTAKVFELCYFAISYSARWKSELTEQVIKTACNCK